MNDSLFFSSVFGVREETLEDHGAFNISVVNDLPLFIDPFLYFNSEKDEYQAIHKSMIDYLVYLKSLCREKTITPGLRKALFSFPEVRQNWMGFSRCDNRGHGLGEKFARSIISGFNGMLASFGEETVSSGSHIEKLCLIQPGIGKDFISDFSANMSLGFLANYTQEYALKHLPKDKTKKVHIGRSAFNFSTGTWQSKIYTLPWHNDDYVLLTPKDILTKDQAWINQNDLFGRFEGILDSLSNEALREQVDAYFQKRLGEFKKKEPTKDEMGAIITDTLNKWPVIIDYFIKNKEDRGDEAVSLAEGRVHYVDQVFSQNIRTLINEFLTPGGFGKMPQRTHDEAMKRLLFMKNVIENKGGHRLFWHNGKSIERENDLQIIYRFTWIGTALDFSSERNDGRGPVDFSASMGASDKTLVEFKLAKNKKLKQNLRSQCAIYEKASEATEPSIKAIFYFSAQQLACVKKILKELKLEKNPNIVLIDVRKDNKPSGSNAA